MNQTAALWTRAVVIDPGADPSVEDQSALGAARGIAVAVVLSVPIWMLLAALVYWLMR